MKITINVDCTPAEARAFMGLPDVAPLQEEMLQEMKERMTANLKAMQPTEMMQAWLPMGMQNWMDMQKQFWEQITAVGGNKEE